MGVKNWVRFDFPSISQNVGFARACSAAFASQLECTLDELEEIKLVVSEAVSNSIIHGYGSSKDGIVTLELKLICENTIEILVEDRGCGIPDVDQALQPAYSSDPDRTGLGFAFMKSFMDELEVTSESGQGTRVRMIKSFISGEEEFGS